MNNASVQLPEDETKNENMIQRYIDEVIEDSTRLGNITRISEYNMCSNPKLPDVSSYISGLNSYAPMVFVLASFAVVIVIVMYVDTLKNILKNAQPRGKSREMFLITLYPVVSITTLLALVVPRAQMLVERVTQGMFVFALYDLFCLYIAYRGGETHLITGAKPSSLNPRVGPCCCFPCCILPVLAVNKRNLMFLRILVIQLPILQCFCYLAFLAMWAENESLHKINYIYPQILVEVSILVATWAILITINMLKEDLQPHAIQGKFMTLQLPFLACKMQWGIPGLLIHLGIMPCNLPLTYDVFYNLVYNALMLVEMIGFGYWARKLYKRDFLQSLDIEIQNSLPSSLSEEVEHSTENDDTSNSSTIVKSTLNLFYYDNLVVVKL